MLDLDQTLDLESLDADQTLDALIEVRQAIGWLKARDAFLLDRLDELVKAGEIDAGGFSHDDYAFSWSAGRRSWTYPAAVQCLEAQLQAAKKAAEADGSATATTGAPFWTIQPPKKP
jgi:hypothetical protein